MAAPALALKSLLAQRFPDAALLPERTTIPIPTGIAELDRVLPSGGLPRGRLVVWLGAEGAGATAFLRAACFRVLARGERAAWVDGQRTLGVPWRSGPLLVRPASESTALRSAEILLRSGGFALVVLTGVDPDQTAMLRLSRFAHEGGGAFVALTHRTLTASLRLSSRFLPADYSLAPTPFGDPARIRSVALALEVRAPGWNASTTLRLAALSHDLRCALDPELADRRGALD